MAGVLRSLVAERPRDQALHARSDHVRRGEEPRGVALVGVQSVRAGLLADPAWDRQCRKLAAVLVPATEGTLSHSARKSCSHRKKRARINAGPGKPTNCCRSRRRDRASKFNIRAGPPASTSSQRMTGGRDLPAAADLLVLQRSAVACPSRPSLWWPARDSVSARCPGEPSAIGCGVEDPNGPGGRSAPESSSSRQWCLEATRTRQPSLTHDRQHRYRGLCAHHAPCQQRGAGGSIGGGRVWHANTPKLDREAAASSTAPNARSCPARNVRSKPACKPCGLDRSRVRSCTRAKQNHS